MASKTTPRKRPREIEFDDMSSVSPAQSAKLHGVIVSLSPMKPDAAKPYFQGYLSDGTKKMRFVGWSPAKEKLIEKFSKEHELVSLSNCTVKSRDKRFGDGLEIVLNDSTIIEKSEKSFEAAGPSDTQDEVCEITLDNISNQQPYQRVTVKVKVVDVGCTSSLDDGRVVQNVIVSGTVKVALWENFVDSVILGKSYKFIDFAVKKKDECTLFTPKQDCTIESIDNLSNVISQLRIKTLQNAKVIGVSGLLSQRHCVFCKNGLITTDDIKDPLLGRCSNCPTTVLVDDCSTDLTATLMIKSNSFTYKLTAIGKHLTAIANVTSMANVTETKLLLSPPFNLTYSHDAIVDVSRQSHP